MKPAISVEGISKEYVIGNETIFGQSFREMVVGSLKSPFRKFRRLSERDARQDRFWALKDVSFDVQPGEIVGVIGRNGAGKSTLLKILSRITTPTEGQITYRGRLASLLEVGTGFHPELTGRENIFLNGAILGMTQNEIGRKLDEIVDFAGIAKFLDTPVKRFSSGMYVRLAFAVAAHLDPEILVVDEVLAVGDIAFQIKCLGKMRDVAGDGRTVLMVSHNMGTISSFCSRGIVLNNGNVSYSGTTEKAIEIYALDISGSIKKDISNLPFNGPGSVKPIEVQIKHSHGVGNSMVSGEDNEIVFELNAESNMDNVEMAFGVYDQLQRRIGIADSAAKRKSFQLYKGNNTVKCKIKKLSLGPGKYYLNISIRRGFELLYGVERCKEIEVYFGTSYKDEILPNRGPLIFDHEWSKAGKVD